MYTCSKCDAQTLKWAGRCPECGAWGSFAARVEASAKIEIEFSPSESLENIKSDASGGKSSGISEFDRVLGGGFAPGGVYLLAGEPGIGKSTLLAQIIMSGRILYVSGEESPEQLKSRFSRVSAQFSGVNVFTDTRVEAISAVIQKEKPILAVVDSIQTVRSESAEGAGESARLRAAAAILISAAKTSQTPIILVGQVTKALEIAGPKSLEHLVDAVLSFEGDRKSQYRLLRAVKNRFGPTDEVGVFEMTAEGLREAKNPSEIFLSRRNDAPGSVVTCVLEGSRPIFLETQALASNSHFPYPERRASGFEVNRLNMLLAVLGKEMGRRRKLGAAAADISKTDIHLNIAGGFRIRDTSADLSVVLAVASSIFDVSAPRETLVFGEVGLGGEVRPVRDEARRVAAAKKLGFNNFLTPLNVSSLKEALGLFSNVQKIHA